MDTFLAAGNPFALVPKSASSGAAFDIPAVISLPVPPHDSWNADLTDGAEVEADFWAGGMVATRAVREVQECHVQI